MRRAKILAKNAAMAEPGYLVSTLVTGILGIGVLVFVLRGRRWHHYVPIGAYEDLRHGGAPPASRLVRLTQSTGTWTLLYVLLVVGFLGAAVGYSSGALSGMVVMAGFGLVLVAFVLIGVYAAMRENGRSSAQAAGAAAIVGGMLAVLAIVLNLVLAL